MTWKVGVPTYDQLALPLLQIAADGAVHTLRDAAEAIADEMQLTQAQRAELLPSGGRTRLHDRVGWAKTYLKKAGLLESAGWGKFVITARGLEVLRSKPPHINRRFLMQFPEFRAFIEGPAPEMPAPAASDLADSPYADMTPQELMEAAYLGLQQDLADDLLDIVLGASPAFFERLVIDVLLAMGYGSSHEAASRAVGRSGDGGIDGIIQEDKLGLDTIYLQAKRWARDKAVGRPEIQAFVGSLIGAGGKKGVFITTSRFSRVAVDYARSMQDHTVILIDGQRLTELMIAHGVGVSVERHYVVQTVDRDYFDLG